MFHKWIRITILFHSRDKTPGDMGNPGRLGAPGPIPPPELLDSCCRAARLEVLPGREIDCSSPQCFNITIIIIIIPINAFIVITFIRVLYANNQVQSPLFIV